MGVRNDLSGELQDYLQEDELVVEAGRARWYEPGTAPRPGTLVATDRRLLHVSETGVPSSFRYDKLGDVRRRGGRLDVDMVAGDHAWFEGERGFLRSVLTCARRRMGSTDLVLEWTRLRHDPETGLLVCDRCGFGMAQPYATCAWCARTIDATASEEAVDAWLGSNGRDRAGSASSRAASRGLDATGALVGSVTADRDGVTHVSGPLSRQWPWGEVDAYHVEARHHDDAGGTILLELLSEHYRHTLHVLCEDIEAWIATLEKHGISTRFDHDPVALREAAAVHTTIESPEGDAPGRAAGDDAPDEAAALHEIAATGLPDQAPPARGITNPAWPEDAKGDVRSSWPQPPPGTMSP